MNIAFLWDFEFCILVETDRRFRGAYFLHHQGNVYKVNDNVINRVVKSYTILLNRSGLNFSKVFL
jgi:hypothetical protein